MKSKKNLSEESERLRQLVKEIGLPLRRLPDIIEERPEDCLAWWSKPDSEIRITGSHLERLAKFIGIQEDCLFNGSYDRELARKRIYGDHSSLPDKYMSNQNSTLRTSAHILRYIKLIRGQSFADEVLLSMNMSPLIYQNVDTKINLTYFADLLETVSKKGFDPNEMDTLASVIFLSLQETILGSKFRTAENMFEVYEVLANNFIYFDTNFEYKSQFVKNKYVLKTTLPLNDHPNLKNDPERLQRLMRYRHILLAWFPYLAGLTPLFPKVEVIRSSSSVLETQYELVLDSPKQRFSLELS